MPTADYYLLTRAHITADYITAQYAGELYDQARSRPEADLRGDLEAGFYFWTLSDSGLRLVHCRVIPLRADQLPDESRGRLDIPPGAVINANHPRPTHFALVEQVLVPSARFERATPALGVRSNVRSICISACQAGRSGHMSAPRVSLCSSGLMSRLMSAAALAADPTVAYQVPMAAWNDQYGGQSCRARQARFLCPHLSSGPADT